MQSDLSDYIDDGGGGTDTPTSVASDEATFPCPWDGCDRVLNSDRGVKVHHKKMHGVSIATPGPTVEVECEWCGGTKMEYPSRVERNNMHFCDLECRASYIESRPKEEQYNWQGGKVAAECAHCGDEKRVFPSRVEKNDYFFCNDECKGGYISENNIGESHPMWVSRIEVDCDWCDGSKEMRPSQAAVSEHHFCCSECKGQWHSANFSGSDNPTWEGGWSWYSLIRSVIGPTSWRMARRMCRDQYGGSCAIPDCGYGGGDGTKAPDVHHIVPVRSGGTHDLELLIPLCNSCHTAAEWYANSVVGDCFPNVYSDYSDEELPDGRLPSDMFEQFCTAVSSACELKDHISS